eukprot:scaffold672_cov268-Pinguiococcus_pyrenoidosus.AAC.9
MGHATSHLCAKFAKLMHTQRRARKRFRHQPTKVDFLIGKLVHQFLLRGSTPSPPKLGLRSIGWKRPGRCKLSTPARIDRQGGAMAVCLGDSPGRFLNTLQVAQAARP